MRGMRRGRVCGGGGGWYAGSSELQGLATLPMRATANLFPSDSIAGSSRLQLIFWSAPVGFSVSPSTLDSSYAVGSA